MAVKKLTFNKEGFVSEETVDKPQKPPEKPPEKRSKGKTSSRGKQTSQRDGTPRAKAVKIKAKGEKPEAGKAGKTVLEQDVIKYRCPRCKSERVADSKEASLTCGLCGARMKLIR